MLAQNLNHLREFMEKGSNHPLNPNPISALPGVASLAMHAVKGSNIY